MDVVDIRKFVDIDITTDVVKQIDSTREVTVLFTANEDLSASVTLNSMADLPSDITSSMSLYKYANSYFKNGGIKLEVVKVTALNSTVLLPLIKELDNEKILVAFDSVNNLTLVEGLAEGYDEWTESGVLQVYGVNEKIFIANAPFATDLTSHTTPHVAVKLIDTTNGIGEEMTIAAYLNQIDFYGSETIQDYAFTPEDVYFPTNPTSMNSIVDNAIKNHGNVDVKFTDTIRNVGGDLSDGESLVNKFALIVCHQTLSQVVFNTLAQKLKGKAAITALYGTISQELNKYVINGYLTTDKIWTSQSVTVTKNGINYTLIEQGTPLIKGYYISILPYSTLTAAELTAHKCPDIYVFLADSYTIRKVTVKGKVGGSIE